MKAWSIYWRALLGAWLTALSVMVAVHWSELAAQIQAPGLAVIVGSLAIVLIWLAVDTTELVRGRR